MLSAFKGEARYYDPFHEDKDYAAEAALLREKYPEAKMILEIGAGTGRLTRELMQCGFSVMPLEPSAEMVKFFRINNPGKRPLSATIQGMSLFGGMFDLVVAHYDVLNYVPFRDIDTVMRDLRNVSADHSIEVWDPKQGVKFWTYKKAGKLKRIRIGFRFRKRAWLFFIFWGKGLSIACHKLYLHDPEKLCPK